MNPIEIKTPSHLTDIERAEAKELAETFVQIRDDSARRIVMAFVEGVAAAAAVSPKVTA